MLSKTKLLPLSELQPGMVSSMDINLDNKTLLTKGVVLTDLIIKKLKETYIVGKVEVFLNDSSDDYLICEIKTVQEIEKNFNEFSLSLEDIFNNLSTLEVPKMSELRVFCEKISQEFKSTGMVIKNILYYGSKNDNIYRHTINVAAISFILGKWLGLNKSELALLTYSATLHDFGKIEIDKDIVDREGNLSPEEYEIFKTHAVISYHFVKRIPYIDPRISRSVLMHHERLDGSGYPLQVKEDKIPKFAKIIAIADIFDEVCSNRYSQTVKGPLDALKVIQEESLGKLNCKYCNMFLNHIVNYFMGESVQLNDGRSCKILQIQMNDLSNPLLLDNDEFLDLNKEKDLYVEKLIVS